MIILVSTVCLFIILLAIFVIYWIIQASPLIKHYQQRCPHLNLEETRWIDDDGMCMVRHWCNHCGFHSLGHVYADPETWLTDLDDVK